MFKLLTVLVSLTFAASFVAELMWVGWAMRQLYGTAPVWISVAVTVAHLLTCLGFAAFLDSRQSSQRATAP